MKEELKKLLLQNLNDIIESSKKGASNLIDALYAQCPDLINQIVKYGIVSNLLFIFIGLINLILYIVSLIIIVKNWNNISNLGYGELVVVLNIIWLGLTLFLAVVSVVVPMTNVLQAIIAPKLYLIEYVKQILN